jgi:hypothetical protein
MDGAGPARIPCGFIVSPEKEQPTVRITRKLRRIALALAATGAVSGAVLGVTMTSASASTIPFQHVQLCSQGNYTTYALFPDRGGLETTLVPAGTCWYEPLGPISGVGWEPVEIYGEWNTHPGTYFYIGTEYYNANVSGIGIGAEGTTTSPWLETW